MANELESVVLGSILHDENTIDTHFLERHITYDFFQDKESQMCYSVLLNMHYQNIKIEPMSVIQFASSNNILDAIGGAGKIIELSENFAIGNLDFYLDQLTGIFIKHEVQKVLLTSKSDFDDKEILTVDDVSALISKLEIYTELQNSTQYLSMSEIFNSLKKNYDEIKENKKDLGVFSEFDTFDKATNGFQKGELYILGARPSIGKTSMALSMAMNTAKKAPTAFISLETPAETISQKIASLLSDIPFYQIRNGFLSDEKYSELFEFRKSDFENRGFFLIDKSNINIQELKGILRHLKIVFNIRVVFVDYIGLVDAGERTMPVYEKQSIVSKSLKSYARELEISICALCQVSRDSEKNEKPPTLANLRGSGSIEQDADVVMFLHGNRVIPKDTEVAERAFYISKNRNGECRQDKIDFVKATTKYKNHEGEQ